MKKNKRNWLKLVVLTLMTLLVFSSFSQGMVKTTKKTTTQDEDTDPQMGPLMDPIYSWTDDFSNEQLIESSMSYDFSVSSGQAKIKSTYPIWTDSSFTCMKPITIQNKIGSIKENYAVKLNVQYDTDMDANYHDLRFKHEGYPTQWLSYWVENHDSSHAIVWVNLPTLPTGSSTLYMFYGKSGASSQSSFYSVFSEWEAEWPNDDKVSVHGNTEGAWDPDVCYGDNKFMVVWEEGEAPYPPYTLYFKQDIRGSIYSASGTPIKEDFTIRSGQDPQWHHENPSVAYGGGKFLVSWEHYYTSSDPHTKNIKARIISSSGSVGNDITICDAADVQGDPMVKYGGGQFVIVWEDARSGTSNYDIYAKTVSTSGSVGSEKAICTQSNNQYEPWVAYDPDHNQYLIVYEEKVPGSDAIDIYGQFFTSSLSPVGSRFLIADGDSSEWYLYPCVEYSEEAERFLVTYNGGTPAKPYRGNVYAKVYNPSGTLMASARIKTGSFIRTDIAPYLGTAFLVCYNGGGKIWGRFIIVDGSITVFDSDIQLSASSSATADWVNVASDENEIYVTWEDTRIIYPSPWNGMPDAYGNIWHLNIGDSSDVSISYGDEKHIILEAQITSKKIEPINMFRWMDFDASYSGNIRFDILTENGNPVSGYQDISTGLDLSGLGEDVIRLKATLTRSDPSYSPTLDQWKVRYIGEDDEPPRTDIDHIDGLKGENEWYTDESVTIWLKYWDLPEQIGSGVDITYYTLNGGSRQTYNDEGGIFIEVTENSNWVGEWDVVFWSVDKAGNTESTGPENEIHIKIDAERPFTLILEPANEQQLNTPFMVRAQASDNAAIGRVEFDIEPFGEREGAPYAPDGQNGDVFYWECNVSYKAKIRPKPLSEEPTPAGTNVMVRAQVYDESGQTWLHEIWVFIENWGGGGDDDNPWWWQLLEDLWSLPEPNDPVGARVRNIRYKLFSILEAIFD